MTAICKSQNIPSAKCLLFINVNISSISLKDAFSVDEFGRKPYWLLSSMLFMFICMNNLLYISLSNTLENDDSSDIGL
jgi:hypothetical protein